MRYYFLVAVIMFLAKNVHADETRNIELRLIPSHIGYSNYSGILIAGSLTAAVQMNHRWQWELGLFGRHSNHYDDFSVFTGPRFNLNDDLSRSWFAGFGVEYGNRIRCCDDDKTWSGYAEIGKRFRMNKEGTWTYAPSAKIAADRDGGAVTFHPANFTYSF